MKRRSLLEELENIADTGLLDEDISIRDLDEPEEIVVEEGVVPEGGIPDRKQGVRSEEAFEKELLLPIEELKELALVFAEDYGYDENATKFPPANDRDKAIINGLLDEIAEYKLEEGMEKTRGKSQEAFRSKIESGRDAEKEKVDTLNDLEAQHVKNYLQKAKSIGFRKIRKQLERKRIVEEDEGYEEEETY